MRRKFIAALILIDAVIVGVIPFIALLIRFEGNVTANYYQLAFNYLPINIIACLGTFYLFGLYRRLWRYASINELLVIVSAVTLSSLIITSGMYVLGTFGTMPKSIYLLSWFLNIALIGASRLFIRVLSYLRQSRGNSQENRVLIIGAGDAGAMIAREIGQRYTTKKLAGFIDDDQYKQNKMLYGAKILGGRQDITRIVKEQHINEIIIAIPSLDGSILRDIIHDCKKTNCDVKTLPGLYELIDGKVTIQQLRKVDLEDLLRREPVNLDIEQIAVYLSNKRVLVTGAGGSIGSELCRQIAKMNPAMLVLLGKGENSIYEIDRELRGIYPKLTIVPIIADVRDKPRINNIFDSFKPQVIFHAAAHKHVPLMEAQPEEAVRNNIFGTKTVAEAADRVKAEIFIMISTDKAVNPTSVMGATKRVAELIVQNLNKTSNTKFAAVRFGNVLGSRGSVIPLFRKQIAVGGPLTITHPDMQRYFMTIPEASQLVLQAGTLAQGGEVFVLDMGEPVKIVDMACDLIELSGLVPYEDIKLEFTGLRPGEKLFEELLTAEEGTASTKHKKIFRANLKTVDEARLQQELINLQHTANAGKIVEILQQIIPTYSSSHGQRKEAETSDKHAKAVDIMQYKMVSEMK